MKKEAFTLIEVVIVVIIISFLASLAWPQLEGMIWRGRYAEVFRVVGSIARAEGVYHLEHGAYADITNSGDDCLAGNGIATGSTKIQRQLSVGVPSESFFVYRIYPGDGLGNTGIYFRQPGSYDWAWVYDYVNKTWWQYGDDGGPAQRYFRPPN